MRIAAIGIVALLVPIAMKLWQAPSERDELDERDAMVQVHKDTAAAALAAGDARRAGAALELASMLAPDDVQLHHERLRVAAHRTAAGESVLAEAQLPAVRATLDALDSLDGDAHKAPRLVARARIAAAGNDPKTAERRYREAVEADDTYVYGHMGMADIHRAAGRMTDALTAYERAVEVAPKNVAALNNLGAHYVDLKRYKDGIALFQRAIEAQDNAASRVNLANALANAERTKEGIEHLIRAAELAPGTAQVHARLGAMLALDGRLAEAEASLVKSLELVKDAAVLFRLGVVYQKGERFAHAASAFQELVKVQPNHVEALFELARTVQALGKGAEAAALFKRYLAAAGEDPAQAKRVAEVKQHLAARARPKPTAPQAPVTVQ